MGAPDWNFIYNIGLGHMTKMAATPIMVKILKNLLLHMKIDMSHWALE